MLYLANPCSSDAVQEYMLTGSIGYIDTPAQGNLRPEGVVWCADNGCYSKGYPGDRKWLEWLAKNSGSAASCLFATAPDVVGDAAATLLRSTPFLPTIRRLGYRAALVAQDGLVSVGDVVLAKHGRGVRALPWSAFDALFIGGTNGWKLGPQARRLVSQAKQRKKHVHMGRVNSLKRIRYAELIGCDTADGTYLRFGPDVNLANVKKWNKDMHKRPALDLFGVQAWNEVA